MESIQTVADIDVIEELKLRRWARENYVSAERRERAWHPVVLDEMSKKDRDLSTVYTTTA
jgi:hypothetical protein